MLFSFIKSESKQGYTKFAYSVLFYCKQEEKLNMIKTSEFSKEHLPCRLRKRKKIHKKVRNWQFFFV